MAAEFIKPVIGAVSSTIEAYNRVASRVQDGRKYKKRVKGHLIRLITLGAQFQGKGNRLTNTLREHEASIASWFLQELPAPDVRPGLLTHEEFFKQTMQCRALANRIKSSVERIEEQLESRV